MNKRYYMLMSSLPKLNSEFNPHRLPLSAENLKQRLKELEPEDYREISTMLKLYGKLNDVTRFNDQEVYQLFTQAIAKCVYESTKNLLIRDLRLQLILAIFRQQRAGKSVSLPEADDLFLKSLKLNLKKPDFGVVSEFPEVREIAAAFAAADTLGLEKTIDNIYWKWLRNLKEDEWFTFKHFLYYCFRWIILRRWFVQESENTGEIFEKLILEAEKS